MSLFKTEKKPVAEEKITDHLSVGLFADGKVMTMIHGVPFVQCRRAILIEKPVESEEMLRGRLEQYRNMDEFLAARTPEERALDHQMSSVSPELELFVHKSSLEGWVESGYNIDVIDSRIAFPILIALQKYDAAARNALYHEIERRWAEGNHASRMAILARITSNLPDGSTVDPTFFAEFFKKMDAKYQKAVVNSRLPTELWKALYQVHSEYARNPRAVALVEYLKTKTPKTRWDGIINRLRPINGVDYFEDINDGGLYTVLTNEEADIDAYEFVRDDLTYVSADFIENETGARGINFIVKAGYSKKGRELIDYAAEVLTTLAKFEIDSITSKKEAKEYAETIEKMAASIKALPLKQAYVEDILAKIVETKPGMDEFITKFVKHVGRGIILATRDGKEHKVVTGKETYYIYEMD